jgi:glutathione synthase
LSDNHEIALVYFKSGFEPTDYPTDKVCIIQLLRVFNEKNKIKWNFLKEWSARLLIERSKTIKAPKIEYQLMNTKKFQQYLSEPNVLEKFGKNIDIEAIRATFFKQYSFGSVKSLNFIYTLFSIRSRSRVEKTNELILKLT